MAEKNELDILQPVDFVPIKGEKVYIRPFMFSRLNEFFKAISEIAPSVMTALQSMEQDDAGNVILQSPVTLAAMLDLYMHNQDNVIELMCFYIERDPSWFKDVEKGPDVFEGVALLAAIVVKNFDFFMNKLLPLVMEVLPKMLNQKKKAPGRK